MYIYAGIFKSLSLDWSNILSQILVYPTSTKHMYFSGRNISWSLEPIYPSCQVIDLGDYFNLSVHTPLQILFYIKRVPNLSVSLYFEDKGRAVASRILKSNILSYTGPKFRNNDLSKPIDMKVLLKLSQNIDSERDQKKRCKNYPNREYVSYLECDRKYFQELILNNAKPPLTPFWITSNHSEVTKLENCQKTFWNLMKQQLFVGKWSSERA